MARFRVTVRSYNFLTAEVEADDNATDDQLREHLFELVELGLVDWETDYTETTSHKLGLDIPDNPA